MLDAMVARGDLNFLFLAPVDSQAMIAPLQAANTAGLPILTVEHVHWRRRLCQRPGEVPAFLHCLRQLPGGQIACRALADALNKTGKVYIQNVKPGISSTDAREKGCKDVLAAEYPNVKMVGVDYNNDDATQARRRFKHAAEEPRSGRYLWDERIQRPGSRNHGEEPRVERQGQGGGLRCHQGCHQYAERWHGDMVIAQKPSDMGYLAVEMAVAYLNGVTSNSQAHPDRYAVITKANRPTRMSHSSSIRISAGPCRARTGGVSSGSWLETWIHSIPPCSAGAEQLRMRSEPTWLCRFRRPGTFTAQTPMLDAMVARGRP